MSESLKSLPDSELKVMMVLWNNGNKMSTGEILNELKEETEWKLSTIQILLGRLVEKGFLNTEKIGRFNYYYPIVESNDYTSFETKNFIKKMFNNSSKMLIASLINNGDELTDKDIEDIKNMLDKGGV